MKFSFATVGKLVAAAALSAVAFGASAQKTQLTVYTALETDQLKAYKEGNQPQSSISCFCSTRTGKTPRNKPNSVPCFSNTSNAWGSSLRKTFW